MTILVVAANRSNWNVNATGRGFRFFQENRKPKSLDAVGAHHCIPTQRNPKDSLAQTEIGALE